MTLRAAPISGVIERRLLVNYRLDPDTAARLLPVGMRPDLAGGYAVGGICLVRLAGLRPGWLPGGPGLRSENAAHRIAVEVDGPDGPRRGVFIPRRDTSSVITTVVGGRLFPGKHHLARFAVSEQASEVTVSYASQDQRSCVDVRVAPASRLTGSALFDDLESASAFFRDAPVGYSPRASGPDLDVLELCTEHWEIEPAQIVKASSCFFDDPARFPAGTAALDCALVMRKMRVTWIPRPPMAGTSVTAGLAVSSHSHERNN